MQRAQRVKQVIEAVQKVYPKQLADSAWDNTGLLVDANSEHNSVDTKSQSKVLLTIDLTESVCNEAIKHNSDIIIAYHPFIFSGIKAISTKNPQHRSLIKLIQHNISVYSPHTAVDASTVGVNDWLVDGVSENRANLLKSEVVQPVSPPVSGQEGAGYGRLVELKQPIMLDQLIPKIKAHLWLTTVQVVKSPVHQNKPIKKIALCAGSGGSVLRGCDADLWFTGELGHHEMLFLKESGTSAVVCGHSNTERGYLPVLREILLKTLECAGHSAEIKISETDNDPIEYV